MEDGRERGRGRKGRVREGRKEKMIKVKEEGRGKSNSHNNS